MYDRGKRVVGKRSTGPGRYSRVSATPPRPADCVREHDATSARCWRNPPPPGRRLAASRGAVTNSHYRGSGASRAKTPEQKHKRPRRIYSEREQSAHLCPPRFQGWRVMRMSTSQENGILNVHVSKVNSPCRRTYRNISFTGDLSYDQ